MKGFRYRLEPVLGHRRFQEDEAQAALSQAQDAHDNERRCLAMLEGQARSVWSRLQHEPGGVIDVDAAQRALVDLSAMAREVAGQEARVQAARQEVEEKQAALARARQERKKLERHREHAHEAFRLEVARAEERAVDDIVCTRHAHRAGAGSAWGRGGLP